ncbi:hypothetical protein JL721_3717 [Aureococcus anophagefferens]|nr:hypothetical protein JL721_3717 [Aureococcus anophagefferens]
MASVSGLLHVRLRSASGCLAVPAASLTAKFRLLPWREEQTTSGAHADADGNATWADDDDGNLVVLAQLAATENAAPRLHVELRSRELYVYERSLGQATVDAAALVAAPGRRETLSIALEAAGDDARAVVVDVEFVAGTTTAPEALERTESQGSLNEGRRHQHLFRLTSYTRPTWCAVCGGLMRRGGGGVAEAATPEKAVSRRPSASVDDIAEEKPRPSSSRGVGLLTLHLTGVRLARDDDDDDDAAAAKTKKAGDYYARLCLAPSRDAPTPTDRHYAKRTHTVYETSDPTFDAKWQFLVESFGAEVRAGGLRREPTPPLAHRNAVAAAAAKRAEDSGAVPYAAPATPRFFDDAENAALRDRAGAVAGAAAFALADLEVFSDDLWWSLDPRYAPNARAGPVLHRDHAEPHPAGDGRRQRHLRAYADYETFMSWDEPLKTGAAFVAFVGCCVFVDAEYAGALPLLAFAAFARRAAGAARATAGELDLAFRRADEEHLGGGAARYRPLAYVKVAVCAGRGVGAGARDEKRTEKPTPGDVYVVASFRHYRAAPAPQPPAVPRSNSRDAPTRSPKKAREPERVTWPSTATAPRKTTAATAPSRRTTTATTPPEDDEPRRLYDEHVLGYTGTAAKTCEPRWHGALGATLSHRAAGPSALLSRLVGPRFGGGEADACSFAVVEPWERRGWAGEARRAKPLVDRALVYPLLQPADGGELRPWAEATGVLVFRVMRQHPIDRLLDSCLGSVEVPVASLVDDDGGRGAQRERRGWHDLELSDDESDAEAPPDVPYAKKKREPPALHLRLQLALRDTSAAPNPDGGRRRARSRPCRTRTPRTRRRTGPAVARRRRRARRVAAAVDGRDRDEYLAWAQNALGRYLDVMESMKNLVNWTHPEKTGLIFVGVLVGAVLFCRIKTRWLTLAFGLYEFTYRLLPSSASTVTCRFLNALKAVPNDRDLRACYGHRAALHAGRLVDSERRRRRRARLHAIWDCGWEGGVELRPDASSAFDRRRLLLLQGHSGLTAPAPTDGAGLPDDRRAHMLAVFGQASDGAPLRWALLCADERDREALGAAIARACDDKLD